MSRNLGTDCCVECGHGPVTLEDLVGQPVELRTSGPYVPKIGTRWDCPSCETAYFACYRTRGDCVGCSVTGLYKDHPGTWEIDLSYWATYNDECYDPQELKGLTEPRLMVTHGREHQRFHLAAMEGDVPFTELVTTRGTLLVLEAADQLKIRVQAVLDRAERVAASSLASTYLRAPTLQANVLRDSMGFERLEPELIEAATILRVGGRVVRTFAPVSI